MPDQHSDRMRIETVKFWKPLLSGLLLILIAVLVYPARHVISGVIIRAAAYMVWTLNLMGRTIPQQVLWLFLVLLILYIAVGSFYGKRFREESSPEMADPVIGPVEAMAEWIEERHRGIYFKWQIANLLGKVQQTILQTASRGTSNRIPPPSDRVQAFLDAGINTSYADYAPDGLLLRKADTPLDIELEQVVDYLEEQMEIKHDR